MQPTRRPKRNAVRMVGAQLSHFRKLSGMTQRELAERLVVSEETIASIEQGRRPLKPDMAEHLDDLLTTKGALAVAVANMPDREKFPVWAAEYMDREREAIVISWYETQLVPGLLQTEAYARAVFRSRVPLLPADVVEQRVADRMERRDILHRQVPPTISFIVGQAALMDRLGGDEVYAEQLRYLREYADLPGLTLQVMRFGLHSHAGTNGPFTILETPDHDLLGYTEGQRGSQLFSDPDEVSILAQKYGTLRTQALNPHETKGLLDQLLGEV